MSLKWTWINFCLTKPTIRVLDIHWEKEQPYDSSLCLPFLTSLTSCFWIPCKNNFHSWLVLNYSPPHSAVPWTEISQEQVGRHDFTMTQKSQLEIASSFTPDGHSETQGMLCCLLHLSRVALVVGGNKTLFFLHLPNPAFLLQFPQSGSVHHHPRAGAVTHHSGEQIHVCKSSQFITKYLQLYNQIGTSQVKDNQSAEKGTVCVFIK